MIYYTIEDYDELLISVNNGWFTTYVKKFDMYLVEDGDYVVITWDRTEICSRDNQLRLRLKYDEVQLGYGGGTPSSAAELINVLENYQVSAFSISPNVTSVTDDGNGVVIVDNTDPSNPVIKYDGLSPLLLMGG